MEQANPLLAAQDQKTAEVQELQEKVIAALKTCYDPEIPVDIWELGLIYELKFDLEKNLVIVMTLTSPMCPVAESLPVDASEPLCFVDPVGFNFLYLHWNIQMTAVRTRIRESRF